MGATERMQVLSVRKPEGAVMCQNVGETLGVCVSNFICTTAEHVGPDALEQLIQHVCLMIGSRTRDVVKSALGFLKVALLLLDTSLLGRHMQTMVR